MKTLGEQWVENGRMYKAVEGIHCSGCCYDEGDRGCYISGLGCPTDNGETDLVIRDLGPVNEDGVPRCPFCGEYPVLDAQENWEGRDIWFLECTGCGARTADYFEASEAVDAWNRRGKPSTQNWGGCPCINCSEHEDNSCSGFGNESDTRTCGVFQSWNKEATDD